MRPKPANDPSASPLAVTEQDLAAYVRGALGRRRRRDVEGFLACNPDVAAQVMTQLHMAGGGRSGARLQRLAAAAVAASALIGASLGWLAAERKDLEGWREPDGASPPEYVQEAAESRVAARVREGMASQLETPRLDAREIQRTLQVSLPRLPASWRVRDVQVFPTDAGPAVTLVLLDASGRRFELFAVRAQSTASERPRVAVRGSETVAYWERGDDAYVLSGPRSQRELLSDALFLATGADL